MMMLNIAYDVYDHAKDSEKLNNPPGKKKVKPLSFTEKASPCKREVPQESGLCSKSLSKHSFFFGFLFLCPLDFLLAF